MHLNEEVDIRNVVRIHINTAEFSV
jgi:hypothetical protein